MKIQISLIFALVFMSLMTVQAQDDYAHSDETSPDYDIVFPQDEVNTMTITISPENWQAMQDNMTQLYGEFGSRPQMGGMAGGMPNGQMPPDGEMPPMNGQMPPVDGQMPPMGGQMPPMGGGMGFGNTENPMWVEATISFEGESWSNVGIRLKGNSSLNSAWGSGNYKLPFRLDFDEFEDIYPETENQRFYGFKELSFSSNWSDDSLLREKVTADIFREAGLVSAQTAFYAVYVDYGEGPVYFGLYTAVEVVDDTVLETQFADDSGNLYKPEGVGANFAEDSFNEETFDKETNEDAADYSDILALFDALHAETRLTNPEAWRSQLEAVFDVDTFMHWLAVNTLVQNWDTYGRMAHNYYLYNDPSTGQLTWIPWDNNMALSDGFGGGGGMRMSSTSLELDTVGEEWPLIRYLIDDPVYQALYVGYVEETMNGTFEPSKMEETYRYYHELIAPYVIGENGETENHGYLSSDEAFSQALDTLISHVNERYATAESYLSNQ